MIKALLEWVVGVAALLGGALAFATVCWFFGSYECERARGVLFFLLCCAGVLIFLIFGLHDIGASILKAME